jgi:hypothetical protein
MTPDHPVCLVTTAKVRMSELLLSFAEQFGGERVRLADLDNALGDRAFGVWLSLFALPNAIPFVSLPGVSTLLGIPLLLFSTQLLLGQRTPWLPPWLAERSIRRGDFQSFLQRGLPFLRHVECLLRPRWPRLSNPLAERLLGGFCLLLAIILVFPIPLGNMLPGLAILLMALGLAEKDGLMILVGVAVGLFSVAIVVVVLIALLEALLFFLRQAFS